MSIAVSASRGTFRSLANYNYRLWIAGSLISNTGTWMQRTAQDWLVLTELTRNNATEVGIVMALQFGPQLLMLPFTGYTADSVDRRKMLIATQTVMGTLALGLGLLTVTGAVQLWQVYLFAGLLGCAAAFDAPSRQTFVAELVGEADISNAVALNSTSFNAARMIGPAAAGLLIASVGTGWVFLINAASYLAVLASLLLLKTDQLYPTRRSTAARGQLIDGFRYVAKRPDLIAMLAMVFLVCTFGFNFAIFIATMAVKVFHTGSGRYGFLTSMMAIGSVLGALLAARRERPRMAFLVGGALTFGLACALAAVMPNYFLFGAVLFVVGAAAQTITASTNGMVQLSTAPAMRGRVMAIYLALALGGTPIGSPFVGWVADTFGARWALMVGAAAGLSGAAVALVYLRRYRGLTLSRETGRLRFVIKASDPLTSADASEGLT